QRMPLLRKALQEKRISYEKARVLARHAEPASLPGLIDKAAGMTCVALRRELEAKEEAQMCARNTISVWMTVRVAEVVKTAFRAARALAKRWLAPGECLFILADHFVKTWAAAVKTARTLQQKIFARDGFCCQVPGCSRPAMHAHHIEFRSHGGSDDPSNLVSLCVAHHLRGIHGGLLRVRGSAPDGLVWEFGLKHAYVPSRGWHRPDVATAAACH
ncbi:MAG: HNH endonuclease, partial [Myxococcales bacterium]